MLNLTAVDWLIMMLDFVFVLGIGFALKRSMKTNKDLFQARRALPAWICVVAFISASCHLLGNSALCPAHNRRAAEPTAA